MDAEYNIFECLPDGLVSWRDSVSGLVSTRLKLHELAKTATNDLFAIRLSTRETVFRTDASKKEVTLSKRVFQIAYTPELRSIRADLLRSRGYGVLSVIGNEAAKTILKTLRIPSDEIYFFLIGHAAPAQTRQEIADWLRLQYPKVKILALNPPNQSVLGADYNVLQNGPEAWLRLLVSTASSTGTGATA